MSKDHDAHHPVEDPDSYYYQDDAREVIAQTDQDVQYQSYPYDVQPRHIEGERERAPRSQAFTKYAIAAGFAGALAVGYGADLILSDGLVPRGTSVAGVKVGGMNPLEAEQKLRSRLDYKTREAVNFKAGVVTGNIDPQEQGLSIDWQRTLDKAGEQPLNPFTRILSFFMSHEVPISTAMADQRLTEYLDELTEKADFPPREGVIEFDSGQVRAVIPQDGQQLQVEQARQMILTHWLDDGVIELPVEYTPTEMDSQQVQQLVDEIAEPAVKRPVMFIGAQSEFIQNMKEIADASFPEVALNAPRADAETGVTMSEIGAIAPPVVVELDEDDDESFSVDFPVERMGEILKFERVENRLEVVYDLNAARGIMIERLRDTELQPVNAKFGVSNGTLSIEPSSNGHIVNWEKTLETLPELLKKTGKRDLPVFYSAVQARLSTEVLSKAGVKELVAEFSTGGLNASTQRNVQVMAQKINGAFIAPGETFSLNSYTGPRSAAQGYVSAEMTSGAAPMQGVGGGASQFATTLYNAAYFAGMEEVSHTPHKYYVSRYPAGRDAIVIDGQVDLAFKNPQSTGIVVEAVVSGSELLIRLWGTKEYEVTSTPGPRTSSTSATPQRIAGGGCSPRVGQQGFTITDTRTVASRFNGNVLREQTSTTSYQPLAAVVCGPAPQAPTQPSAEQPADAAQDTPPAADQRPRGFDLSELIPNLQQLLPPAGNR